ncbi:MAG: hypothetical protein PF961_00845 [Planctomycetota bacterium]|jgi:hypothetical protein|nr:hypothetical protein [Planctomycetota bacterium]
MICFLDFEPRQLEAPGLFKGARMEDLDTVLADLNAWVAKNGAEVISIETVVLPNIHRPHENGTADPSLLTNGDLASTWHQFFRLWYRA